MNFRQHQQAVREGRIKPIAGSCTRCDGWGYTEDEAPEGRQGKKPAPGSGCYRCLGTGIDPEWAMARGLTCMNFGACKFS